MLKFTGKNTLAATALMLGASVSGAAMAADTVALLLPENVNPRWEQQDAAAFVRTMSEIAPDVKVEVFNANNDTATQQRQAEQALTQGAKVLVVIPIDGESSAIIADKAAEENVPTIAYDRMINSKNTKFWVQADMHATGAAQAQHVVDNTKDGDTLVMLKGSPTDPNAAVIAAGQMSVLEPLFTSGARKLGYENWTPGWDPAIARRSMDQALTQLGNNVQGVVSSNDGNAGAAIASMEEQDMAGKVPVSGLDCTVQAMQLMLLGKQTQCGWRPLHEMAAAAAKVSVRLLKGEAYDDLATEVVKNGVGADVAFVPVDSYSAVGAEGVAYVVENDPSVTKEMVCQDEAAKTDFCK
ncbi:MULTISPECIES: ABC transporter substrate-binding protein [unclassified Shinella]|uniref:ABC transporter substrate-binding protein n=2 Tax=Bacteria TaxID=2 RepID=UPI00234E79C9|nr:MULTISPECIES: sugar ABC transporter substrate-binding protein [unclassified Shinella]MCO5154022.1 sugar ABC transporter substrate-binding protein [Shinella sp.]MDC7266942.1 sugar ABC transporter substrate-binding protein [Shinella sp. HY16]MDC7273839.1 sugar ABC transporter substrate-binding protein [Shinella sp. YZ44]